MCACSNQLERHCRWPFMTTITMPLRWPNQPLRLTIRMPNQGVAKLTPVPPSVPPPPHLLALPKATAKASGGGGASSCGAKRGAVGKKGAVKDTSKAAKINLTEYLARYQLRRIRQEWKKEFEAIAHDVVDTWTKCTKLPRYRCQGECPPRVGQLGRQWIGRLIRGSGAYKRADWRQDVEGHEAPYSP